MSKPPLAQQTIEQFLESTSPNRAFVMIFDRQVNGTTNLVWGASIDRVLLLQCLKDFIKTEGEVLQKELAGTIEDSGQQPLSLGKPH